jgi:hypothetical protein
MNKKSYTIPLLSTLVLIIITFVVQMTRNTGFDIRSKAAIGSPDIVENFEDTVTPLNIAYFPTPAVYTKPNASLVYVLPLVFAIEKTSLMTYPDAEKQIRDAIDNINGRMSAVGIKRQWKIDHFAPIYDKTIVTSCRAGNPNGKYLPIEFCNHNPNYVFVAVDETPGFNTGGGSIEWHGYNGLFGKQGVSVLGHELGHALGQPDFYHISISAENNMVNGEEYKPFTGYIMHNLTPGFFTEYDALMINKNKVTLPLMWATWLWYQPTVNKLKITDSNNTPVYCADVNVYTSNPSIIKGGYIDDRPEYSGRSDTQGMFTMGGNILGSNDWFALKAFLIKVTIEQTVTYAWLNTMDVNLAYLKGQKELATYPVKLNYVPSTKRACNTPTPIPNSPTPTPTPSGPYP